MANSPYNNKDLVLPRGRPPINIDIDQLDKLCAIHCTTKEIADFFNVSHDSIERFIKNKFGMTFGEYRDQKSSNGKISLRRAQYRAAMEGNVQMLIWLGGQWLGQSNLNKTMNMNVNANLPGIGPGDDNRPVVPPSFAKIDDQHLAIAAQETLFIIPSNGRERADVYSEIVYIDDKQSENHE